MAAQREWVLEVTPTDTPPPYMLLHNNFNVLLNEIVKPSSLYFAMYNMVEFNDSYNVLFAQKLSYKIYCNLVKDMELNENYGNMVKLMKSKVWKKGKPTLVNFILKVYLNVLPTKEFLGVKYRFAFSELCQFCQQVEDINHILFRCKYFYCLRSWFYSIIYFQMEPDNVKELFELLNMYKDSFHYVVELYIVIWKVRCKAVFEGILIDPLYFYKTCLYDLYVQDIRYMKFDDCVKKWNDGYLENLLKYLVF